MKSCSINLEGDENEEDPLEAAEMKCCSINLEGDENEEEDEGRISKIPLMKSADKRFYQTSGVRSLCFGKSSDHWSKLSFGSQASKFAKNVRDSQLQVYLYGSQVTSWKNDHGEELLFVSSKIQASVSALRNTRGCHGPRATRRK